MEIRLSRAIPSCDIRTDAIRALNMHSPELETLDQLLSGDMPISVIGKLYSTPDACRRGLLGLLREGDVILLNPDQGEIPQWQWRQLFSQDDWLHELRDFRLRITEQGTKKIA
ncbi:MAG: hypothetical protein L0Z53_18235 [Acidobacteriales bacterium]|nr:hypothetical protein [Terriglobales bacterium]